MAEVIWSQRANKRRIEFLTYGKREFGLRSAIKMNEQIESYVHSLANNPNLGSIEPLLQGRKKEYCSLVVHTLIKLIYWVDKEKARIYIADLWQTRREPVYLAKQL